MYAENSEDTDQTVHSCFSIGPDIQMKYSKVQRKKNKGLCPVIQFFVFVLLWEESGWVLVGNYKQTKITFNLNNISTV